MKTYFISLLVAGFLLTSCNNRGQFKNGSNASLPYIIDIEKDINNVRSVPLSTLGSQLEYILLETDSVCLIKSVSNAFVSDSFIYVSDGSRVLLFTRNGKFLKQIGAAGRGPGEYSRIADFIIDKNNREIYVLSSRIVLIYDFNGQFKRDFKLDFPCTQFILREKDSFVFHPFNLSQPTSEPVYSWYIIDKMGIVQTKIINKLKRINKGLIVPTSPLYVYKGTPHFMEFGIDTLYDYNDFVMKPYAIFHSGNMKMNPDPTITEVPGIKGKIWISAVQEIEKALFIKIWWDLSDSITNCIFDKSSSRFTVLRENGFVNDIDGGMAFWPKRILNDNFMIDFADAFDLIKYVNNSQSKKTTVNDRREADHLKDVVKQLTETSNPVLIILKQ